MSRILITGATGQIGSELTPTLRERHGRDAVIASSIETLEDPPDPYVRLDVTDTDQFERVLETYDIDTVYHLAAILSAVGEQNPQLTYRVNIEGLFSTLELCRSHGIEKVIVPSSIAVFGPSTPDNPREATILEPTTMYGISKVLLERFAQYYHRTYDLDIRGVRLPGVLSYKTEPGGGTTDYAVEAFYGAVESGSYTYYVGPETRLPMMYMPDAINALVDIADADAKNLRYRCSYNVGAMSFTAGELTAAIQEHLPTFEATYEPDDRQAIADSWPDTVDDSAARADWGWNPSFSLSDMVADMFENLR